MSSQLLSEENSRRLIEEWQNLLVRCSLVERYNHLPTYWFEAMLELNDQTETEALTIIEQLAEEALQYAALILAGAHFANRATKTGLDASTRKVLEEKALDYLRRGRGLAATPLRGRFRLHKNIELTLLGAFSQLGRLEEAEAVLIELKDDPYGQTWGGDTTWANVAVNWAKTGNLARAQAVLERNLEPSVRLIGLARLTQTLFEMSHDNPTYRGSAQEVLDHTLAAEKALASDPKFREILTHEIGQELYFRMTLPAILLVIRTLAQIGASEIALTLLDNTWLKVRESESIMDAVRVENFNQVALTMIELGQLEKAQIALEQVQEIISRNEYKGVTLIDLNNLNSLLSWESGVLAVLLALNETEQAASLLNQVYFNYQLLRSNRTNSNWVRPLDAYSYKQLAYGWLELGQPDKAEKLIRESSRQVRAYSIAPNPFDDLGWLALEMIRHNYPARALELLAYVKKQAQLQIVGLSGRVDALRELIPLLPTDKQKLLNKKNTKLARQFSKKARSSSATGSSNPADKIRALAEAGRFEEAENNLAQLESQREQFELLLAITEIMQKQGQVDKALQKVRKIYQDVQNLDLSTNAEPELNDIDRFVKAQIAGKVSLLLVNWGEVEEALAIVARLKGSVEYDVHHERRILYQAVYQLARRNQVAQALSLVEPTTPPQTALENLDWQQRHKIYDSASLLGRIVEGLSEAGQWQEALKITRTINDPSCLAEALVRVARALLRDKQAASGQELARQALALSKEAIRALQLEKDEFYSHTSQYALVSILELLVELEKPEDVVQLVTQTWRSIEVGKEFGNVFSQLRPLLVFLTDQFPDLGVALLNSFETVENKLLNDLNLPPATTPLNVSSTFSSPRRINTSHKLREYK